jgi:GNAT superfamily N-acetyltransferase
MGLGQEVTLSAYIRGRGGRAIRIGRAGLCLTAGSSPAMDEVLKRLFPELPGVPKDAGVAPMKHVFVDPRYRGHELGRELFLRGMEYLKDNGIHFAIITVLDSGSGSLFEFYRCVQKAGCYHGLSIDPSRCIDRPSATSRKIGFRDAEHLLGVQNTMIAYLHAPPTGRSSGGAAVRPSGYG